MASLSDLRGTGLTPYLKPGAYVTDGTRLFEITEAEARFVLQDVKTEALIVVTRWRLTFQGYRLVKEAPECPALP